MGFPDVGISQVICAETLLLHEALKHCGSDGQDKHDLKESQPLPGIRLIEFAAFPDPLLPQAFIDLRVLQLHVHAVIVSRIAPGFCALLHKQANSPPGSGGEFDAAAYSCRTTSVSNSTLT